MTNQRVDYIEMSTDLESTKNPVPLEFNLPRFTQMTPAMLLIMCIVAMAGIYIGYQINHSVIVSLVIGGVFGRIGMWAGMIGCGLIAGIEDFLKGIF